ncbi:Clavaminate synthase-like protein [Viridothelium virens]|uniref:Clavaminate synthase-like protein n=1 Tax=Viridothelium virens TaxID=1048519 RepID=A0A6A6H603_VIRVR|nr:Clavaminate synthase-like protein [Viridothelium virens]
MAAPNPSHPPIPVLDLSQNFSSSDRSSLLTQLQDALFHTGFLYINNHGVNESTINNLVDKLPLLFDLPPELKNGLSKMNSPHFLGYSGYAEETTLGKKDLREQWDFGSDVPAIWNCRAIHPEAKGIDNYERLYWRLRGPNQWPPEDWISGFRDAYMKYHAEIQDLSYRFVHLVEEALGIPVGTFDSFWKGEMQPQHRIKLIKYPPRSPIAKDEKEEQGVGAHKDSSGWLTFLYQVGKEEGLEVLGSDGKWIEAPPVPGTFVVNFGNAFEAATEGAVKATVHRVKARSPTSSPRYSIPFFQGLPLDMTVSEIRSYIPQFVRNLRAHGKATDGVSAFLDSRWDSLGESQLRKWLRSHEDVGRKWYGNKVVEYYLQ